MKPNFRLLESIAKMTEKIPPKHFDLREWFDVKHCGSIGCSLGWWNQKFPKHPLSKTFNWVLGESEAILGLTADEYDRLFFRYAKSSPGMQARYIRKFIANKKAKVTA